MSEKKGRQWNVKMNRRRLVILILLFFIPILVLTLHLITNFQILKLRSDQGKGLVPEFFGTEVSLTAIYDVVLYLTIFVTISCIILFLMESRKRRIIKK